MSTGDVFPEAPSRPPSGQRWGNLKVVLIAAVLGLPTGGLWRAFAPLPRLKLDPQGVLFVGSQAETSIAADAWFGIAGAIAGALCAVIAFRVARGANPRVLIALTLGGLLGSVIAWRVGLFLSPAPIDVQAKALALGDEFDGPLVLSAFGMLLAWPLAAVTTYFSLVAGLEPAPTGHHPAGPRPTGYTRKGIRLGASPLSRPGATRAGRGKRRKGRGLRRHLSSG